MSIELLPQNWVEKAFAPENIRQYSLLKIDPNINGFAMGRSSCGCYALTLNPAAADFLCRLADFIAYETAYNRTVLIFSPGYEIAGAMEAAQKIRPGIRETDPHCAVHSTLLSSYKKIIHDGSLKSVSRLVKEGISTKAIGFATLGEPDDYLDYIMFAPLDGMDCGNEMVVNSRLRGEACFDPNAAYAPQARMYFDAHKLIENGLAVRDGTHFLKVYDQLPIADYLLLTIFEKDVTLPKGQPQWTPTLFTEQANALFARKFSSLA
jgi:hypothetical protein